MRLKETTKKSNAVKTATLPPLSGDLLRSLHISTPHHQLLHHPQLQHQHHQQRCSSVGSTSSSGTCETDRSTASACSALSPAGMMPGLGAGGEGLLPGGPGGPAPGPGHSDEAAAAAVLAANIAESFTFLQQHAAHHFRDILYAAHMLGRGKAMELGSRRELAGEGGGRWHGGPRGRDGRVAGRSVGRIVARPAAVLANRLRSRSTGFCTFRPGQLSLCALLPHFTSH